MAKRFTDTSKWAKERFAELSLKMKLVWIYLCDNCDHAGVWDINIGLMSYQIGQKITIKEIIDTFGSKVELRGDRLFLPSFIEFQYGALNPDNRVHQSVLLRLEKLAPYKDLTSTLQGSKDKDKDKEQDKAKDKDKYDDLKISKAELVEAIEKVYELYPRKEGKALGIKKAIADIKTRQDMDRFKAAVLGYVAHTNRHATETKFIKHFSTFVTEWRDWTNPEHGLSAVRSNEDLFSKIFDEVPA